MYENFFGFKERPFQLVPNPAYLFLSRSHEEAIAHLNYAVSHGDGFVEISGEVGTGKTTLCRAFLENLGDRFEVAYIFNPQLNALELLRTINQEFGINSSSDQKKDLVDHLNIFLMNIKTQNKNAILLIDEAQNLGKDVLEQLRLLSNLETNTSKLLQIILVGQPELQTMLDSYELRQLRQRITLSWYLTPLSPKETREYIRHRINIASKKSGDKFTHSAYHYIYKYSHGIPRLINIACDRALLTAFGFNRRKVTGHIARLSIKELNARDRKNHHLFSRIAYASSFIALIGVVALTMFLSRVPPSNPNNTTTTVKHKPLPSRPPQTTINPDAPLPSTNKFENFLRQLPGSSTRLSAIKTTISLWETPQALNPYLDNISNDADFFQYAAGYHQLNSLPVNKDFDLVKKLNLPAILEFILPGTGKRSYLTLVQVPFNDNDDEIILKGGDKEEIIRVKTGEFYSYWTGNAYILWKDFYHYQGDIPINQSPGSVFTLKMLLRDIGFKEIKLDRVYDNATRTIIMKLQEKHGLTVDGIVGARTKIIIYNEKLNLKIPHIRHNRSNHSNHSSNETQTSTPPTIRSIQN